MYKEKAEAYVRGRLPEMFYSFCSMHQAGSKECAICKTGTWSDPQLQHWLKVLTGRIHNSVDYYNGETLKVFNSQIDLEFNLTTGQPATEEDYKAFCEVVGIVDNVPDRPLNFERE